MRFLGRNVSGVRFEGRNVARIKYEGRVIADFTDQGELVLPSVVDSDINASTSNTTTKEVTFTVSALNNGQLIVFISHDDSSSNEVTSVTWFPDGTGTPGTAQSLSKFDDGGAVNGSTKAEAWHLLAPTAGANGTLRMVLAEQGHLIYRAVTVQNAKQDTPLQATSAESSSQTISTDLITTSDKTLILDHATGAFTNADRWTATGDQTEIAEMQSGQGNGAFGALDADTAGTYTCSWSQSDSPTRLAHVVIGVEPAT